MGTWWPDLKKERKKEAEAIPVNMHQWQTATKYLKNNNEKPPTLMVHPGHINETTTLYLTT